MESDATLLMAIENEEIQAEAEALKPAIDAYHAAIEATGVTYLDFVDVAVPATQISYANAVSSTTAAY